MTPSDLMAQAQLGLERHGEAKLRAARESVAEDPQDIEALIRLARSYEKKGETKKAESCYLRAMALEPDDRYATPEELAGDLERWMAGEPVSAWTEPWTVRARRWETENRS